MNHFFIDENMLSDEGRVLTLRGDDHHHAARVLRLKKGEEISAALRGDDNREYRFGVEEVREDETVCALRFVKDGDSELDAKLILLQCLPKSGKMELIIQKAVELGVSEIVPVESARSVVKLDAKRAAAKTSRWQGIADAAAKQSRRGMEPEVTKVTGFDEALEAVEDADVKLIAYELSDKDSMEKTRSLIDNVKKGQEIAVLVGPEGGFDVKEVEKAVDAGFVPVTMGRRILRTETAGLVMLSWLVYRLE